ncbi:ribosomal-protein-alanine N-acetyltransferase [Clostridium vincentii]|uniref:Ribosomal-protein-alanine N-acetyltransferase n=2 Tax=Clostridium vincentii TaxID=52704 RepID=A0A2T0BBW9_9CLOT|nr:ribosomal-protein-alanine N-acetyltransferase [Clostridium vincentii]
MLFEMGYYSMVTFERLNSSNFENFKSLLKESKEKVDYREDFYKYYDNKSFIFKFIMRKLIKLIKVSDNYVGYLWIENPSPKNTVICDMFIKEEYLTHFNSRLLLVLDSSIITYECLENAYSLNLLKKLSLTRIRLTYLMSVNPKDTMPKPINTKISYSLYNPKNDAQIRCNLQNAIFKEDSRIPLSIEDIYYDEKQDYYLEDLSIFIKLNNRIIGYGQIIYSREMYTLVNFGILQGFRARGYGESLICELVNLAKKKGIDNIFIRVDHDNFAAKKLYDKVGFREVGKFSTWLWSKEFVR